MLITQVPPIYRNGRHAWMSSLAPSSSTTKPECSSTIEASLSPPQYLSIVQLAVHHLGDTVPCITQVFHYWRGKVGLTSEGKRFVLWLGVIKVGHTHSLPISERQSNISLLLVYEPYPAYRLSCSLSTFLPH